MLDGFCSSSGGGVVVKKGGNTPEFPPRGVFVVVVVVADKEHGGNKGGWRRQARNLVQNLTPTLAIVARRLCSRAPRQTHKALHAKGRGAKAGMPDVVAVFADW